VEALEDRWLPSTLTVTSTQDSGAGSLRADIAAAQSGDTIVFSSTLFSSSKDGHGKPKPPPTTTPTAITLTSGELNLTKSLTIQGPGAGNLTISGNNASRVFEVAQGTTVTLSGLTISKGDGVASASSSNPWGGYGGGILNHGTLTVSGGTFSGNSAHEGGGIYSDGGTVTVSSSTLFGNAASYGGGMYNSGGTATVSNGSILSTNDASSGGGIYIAGGTVTVSNSTLSGNTAYNGGGILNHGTLTVSNSTVSNNQAYDDGGGIFSDGTLALSGCTVSGNIAYYGGGIENRGTATLISTTVSGNSARALVQSYPFSTEGGGILNHGTLTLSACTVSGNFSEYEGGGIFNDGTLTVKNSSSIAGNTISANTASGYAAEDFDNLGVLYLDSTSTIGILDGNPAIPI
jgi:predicted outer membrane repeat protein